MDREAIRTSADYKKLEDQYFDGGYYSPKVREIAGALEGLTEVEKQVFYGDHFNLAWSMAERIQADPRFEDDEGGSRINMIQEGLGTIRIRMSEIEDDGPGAPAFKILAVEVVSFNPVSPTTEDWDWNKDSDPMGLETSHSVTRNVRQYPENYSDEVYADLDGSICYDRAETLDEETLNLLNAFETLSWVEEELAKSSVRLPTLVH